MRKKGMMTDQNPLIPKNQRNLRFSMYHHLPNPQFWKNSKRNWNPIYLRTQTNQVERLKHLKGDWKKNGQWRIAETLWIPITTQE